MQAETVAGKAQKLRFLPRGGNAKDFAFIADDKRYPKAAKIERAKTFRAIKAPLRSFRPLLGIDSIQGKHFFIPSEFYVPFRNQNNGANNVRKELNSEAKNPILKL